MSESTRLLKEEINKTNDVENDLAKWKLVVAAALGAAAIGLGQNHQSDTDPRWLLLVIPFVCAYIDLYGYQNSLRVLVIAQFLRGAGADPTLQKYEEKCDRLRQTKSKVSKVFALAGEAGIASSIGLSVIAPALYVVTRSEGKGLGLWKALSSVVNGANIGILLLWLFGVLLIVGLRLHYGSIAKRFSGIDPADRVQISNTADNHEAAA
jgi:hypothetical protein